VYEQYELIGARSILSNDSEITKTTIKRKSVKPLRSLLGALPDIDMKKIYEDHDREVELEDEEDRKATLPPV